MRLLPSCRISLCALALALAAGQGYAVPVFIDPDWEMAGGEPSGIGARLGRSAARSAQSAQDRAACAMLATRREGDAKASGDRKVPDCPAATPAKAEPQRAPRPELRLP